MAPRYGTYTTPPTVYRDGASRVERAERRLRAAEALVRDLQRALADEHSLALYTSTPAARARAREESQPEPALAPSLTIVLVDVSAARRVNRRPREIAAELRKYGDACVKARRRPIAAEVAPLLTRASEAGLGLESFAAMIEGRK